ncbi:MAG: hypothetical protein NVS4B10_08610 [Myxococcales bacterium]
MRRPIRGPSRSLLLATLAVAAALLPACVAHAPATLPPPPPISRAQAVGCAFDFAERNGYGRVSVRSAGRDGDAWDVHLRVERPFRGKVLVFLNAFTGEVLRADVYRVRTRPRDEAEEREGRRGRERDDRDED